jgi:hypothetical protein
MYVSTRNSEEIVSAVTEMEMKEGDVAAIFLGEKNRPDVARIISGLNREGIDFIGGIFPGIIHGDKRYEEGAVMMTMPVLKKPFLIKGLDTEAIELPDFGALLTEDISTQYTAMILVDGLTSNIALFLAEMFNQLGNSVHYFGGGGGSLSLQQEPCLFCPEGFFQDAAIVSFVKLESNLGVRHGWEEIKGPMVATRTEKNIIFELNWENAFDVYRETVEADSGKKLTAENFFDIAKGYPFGIMKEGEEHIVRDPIAVNEKGELICVGEVPENAALSIMKGNRDSLIRAAAQAVDDCVGDEKRGLRLSLIADCISRVIFLEDDFSKELEAVNNRIQSVHEKQTPLGMLTLGEISSYGEGFLEFFNKTIVVGTFYGG